MRERHCVTVLDPFHQKYGKALAAAMSLVSLTLDMFWVPATLTGLGWFSTCGNDLLQGATIIKPNVFSLLQHLKKGRQKQHKMDRNSDLDLSSQTKR